MIPTQMVKQSYYQTYSHQHHHILRTLKKCHHTTEDQAPVTANSKEHSALPQDSDRLESQSQPVLNSPEHLVHQDTEQSREDADLIDHHNITTESD